MVKLNKTDELIISILKTAGKELTFAEIVEKSGERPKKIFTSLRKLFENEIVDARERRYKLVNP